MRITEHIRANTLLWYVALIVTLIAIAQFGVGDHLHEWVYGG